MRTEHVQLDGAADAAKLTHAAQILRSGGLVAFPTETVYGLGADAGNPEALARLARIKGKLDGKNYSLLVGSMRQAEQVAGGLSRTAQKLARMYWPGALTLVVPRAGGGNVGLRLPEHPIARSLLAECAFPIAAPNATLRINKGCDELGRVVCDGLSAEHVREAFDGKIDLVLEGGMPPRGTLSAVVEVNELGVKVQREGKLTELDILLTASPTVLFVCTGNTCRSSMASAIFRAVLARRPRLDGMPVRVLSAGTNAQSGQPAHPLAITAMRESGVDMSDHRTTLLTPDMIDSADWIFTMTRAHRDSIIEFMPFCADRIQLLSKDNDDIAEPGGREIARYRQCRDNLATCLLNVLTQVESD